MPTAHKDYPPRRRSDVQFVTGLAVGILEVLCLNPLDLVKSRLQVQGILRMPSRDTYSGVRDAFVKIYRHEGLATFWRGMVPSMLVTPPRRGIKFFLMAQLRPMVQVGAQATPLTYATAGALSGTIEALAMNPFEVVKITQQVHEKKGLNALAMARRIARLNGYGQKGLYRGITALIARNAIFQFTYFGLYTSIGNRLLARHRSSSEIFRRFAIACFAGAVGLSLSVPLDMAKCRIQAPQPVRGEIKYGGTVQTLRTVYCEEGIRAMYKGLAPLFLRAIPGGAILIVSYEAIYNFLIRRCGATNNGLF
ncbi:hypothetical protein KR038_000803 [Drosophila bunnanda]|nr:hypothetical protein KR038_000803 [Drosophila bunnanda]